MDGQKLYINKPSKKALKQHKKGSKDYCPPLSSSPSVASTASASSAPPVRLSSSSSMGGSGGSASPPSPPKQSFARRFKYLWPLLLTANLGVGAYILMRTRKKDTSVEEAAVSDLTTAPVAPTVIPPAALVATPASIQATAVSDLPAAPAIAPTVTPPAAPDTAAAPVVAVEVPEMPSSSPPVIPSAKLPEPIPSNQQRELFKWLLDEKRKMMPKDWEEKKRIDEDKAILKKFNAAKSIPTF